jgi:hypothetical protein
MMAHRITSVASSLPALLPRYSEQRRKQRLSDTCGGYPASVMRKMADRNVETPTRALSVRCSALNCAHLGRRVKCLQDTQVGGNRIPSPEGFLRESVLHRYAQDRDLVRGRLPIS